MDYSSCRQSAEEYNKSVREFEWSPWTGLSGLTWNRIWQCGREYAYAENIHPAIISYLSIKGQNFCRIETTVDGKLFATPRGWEDLSQLILVYESLEKRADRDVISQYIQHPQNCKRILPIIWSCIINIRMSIRWMRFCRAPYVRRCATG